MYHTRDGIHVVLSMVTKYVLKYSRALGSSEKEGFELCHYALQHNTGNRNNNSTDEINRYLY